MFDFIGDIHGHADKLESLLQRLGYKKEGGVYQHPTRKVFFLGDFIDRGPKILEVLNIVIPMVQKGNALAIMGNHEYNYLSFHTPSKNGHGYLRERVEKNIHQCQATLDQLSESENQRLLKWIWELPLWFETDSFRAVHACWDENSANLIGNSKLSEDILFASSVKGSPAYEAIEIVLKGKEIPLPPELFFKDKDKIQREDARVCWWDLSRKIIIPTKGFAAGVYETQLAQLKVPHTPISKTIFFGHYWEAGVPKIVNPKAACLDYSVAKDGYLCAYRFDNEPELNSEKLVFV